MKFVLFVEGHTEKKVLNTFLKRWLDKRLNNPVGIDPVLFSGWRELIKNTPKKAELYSKNNDVIGIIALLDLYGPDKDNFYPKNLNNPDDRYKWAKNALENKAGQNKFRQFFAVHEIEAWLLSDEQIFNSIIMSDLTQYSKNPERVDFDRHPAKILNELYLNRLNKGYKKIVDGAQLFNKLDPEIVYSKCPHFKEMMDEMLKMAKEAVA